MSVCIQIESVREWLNSRNGDAGNQALQNQATGGRPQAVPLITPVIRALAEELGERYQALGCNVSIDWTNSQYSLPVPEMPS